MDIINVNGQVQKVLINDWDKISISELVAGIYFIRIFRDNEVVETKMIVKK